eukprot:3548377-Alexandrium_andersonii.AAC.1
MPVAPGKRGRRCGSASAPRSRAAAPRCHLRHALRTGLAHGAAQSMQAFFFATGRIDANDE